MKVKLKVERQVYGRPIQKKGEIIDLSQEEAERLISIKQAELPETKEK